MLLLLLASEFCEWVQFGIDVYTGPILECKGIHVIFQKKMLKKVKKGKIFES